MKMPKEYQQKFMAEAIKEAKEGLRSGEIPVGCVIVKNGKIISSAHNTVEKNKSTLCHAEIIAIDHAQKVVGKYLDECTMFVTVEPCAMCAGAIVGARVGGLYFGTAEERTGCCESLYAITQDSRFFCNVPTYGGIMEEECKKLMKEFFANRR